MNISELKGVGPTILRKLNSLGINTVVDLLEYYPYRYNFIDVIDINKVNSDEVIYVRASIVDIPKVQYIKRNLNKMTFRCVANNTIINVSIFNRAFLKTSLKVGKDILLVGKYNKLKNNFVANDIKLTVIENGIEPIYHLCDGLTNNNLRKIIYEALRLNINTDYIPNSIIAKYNFISKIEAINKIHNPKNKEDIKISTNRLKYEELFNFMFKINALKIHNSKQIGIKRNIDINIIEEFKHILPFELTVDQNNAINEIYKDLTNDSRMNRIVLGDVGSGKTIVATFGIYLNFLCGYQSALMAPTEILANQHYNNLKKMLSSLDINIALLTSSVKTKERKEILENLENGNIDLIIGTHSLLSEDVKFKNLTLSVCDEQHRFGVDQRNIFQEKGKKVDVLYLSATPIPRTYALTIYGDLDVTLIKTKPTGRKEVTTIVKKETEIKDVLYKMLEELKNNHQIYVVSPLIENNESELKSVFDLKEKLDTAFQHKVEIAVLHGKLKQNEKDKIMDDYKNGLIKILISTTVIEVGIDVKNSTMMVIYNAERFGLATLHQLRGRVGRSDLESFCYLISNYDIERLKVLEESNDGFYISEKDAELRGTGDLFGQRQSGDMEFKIANLKTDYDILIKAKDDSLEFLNSEYLKNNEYYNNEYKKILFLN